MDERSRKHRERLKIKRQASEDRWFLFTGLKWGGVDVAPRRVGCLPHQLYWAYLRMKYCCNRIGTNKQIGLINELARGRRLRSKVQTCLDTKYIFATKDAPYKVCAQISALDSKDCLERFMKFMDKRQDKKMQTLFHIVQL